MANKVWTGDQSAYDALTSRPIDDYFVTKIGDAFNYTYHDAPALDVITSLAWEKFIDTDDGENGTGKILHPVHLSEFIDNSTVSGWNTGRAPLTSHTINVGNVEGRATKAKVLNKMYRGKIGTCYSLWKFQYTDNNDPTNYNDVRAGYWCDIGYTTKTPGTCGIEHSRPVNSLPDVSAMSDSQIISFLAGDYKLVLLLAVGDATADQELVDVQTISNANRTKYLYQV